MMGSYNSKNLLHFLQYLPIPLLTWGNTPNCQIIGELLCVWLLQVIIYCVKTLGNIR
jgi:hypothetical protein